MKGTLFVMSGPSGTGKGTICNEILRTENIFLSISATTREIRLGETDGVTYNYLQRDEFEKLIEDGEMLEYAQYNGNYYGTPKAYVEKQLAAGKNVILEIEIQGALLVKEKNPDTLLLFVTPPSAEEHKKRLVGRGTETMEEINARLTRAIDEAPIMEKYDYIVINDEVENCVDKIHELVDAAKHSTGLNREFIEMMKKELTELK